MAIVWQKQTSDTLYEIRSAGHSVRLYTNNVFHSQFNPRNSVTGNVWDLLSLPVFLFPNNRPLNVLLLGVGGGAVIHQLQGWHGHCDITGIELNKTHLMIARRFFGVTAKDARLVHDDAQRWVNRQRKPRYDLIIDDLFGDADGEPQRAIAITPDWASKLTRLLNPDGVIVANFAERAELMNSAFCACASLKKQFSTRFQLTTPLYENRIGVFSRQTFYSREWRNRVKSVDVLSRALRRGVLNYHLSTL